ncbi:hypothetical protein DFP72DRAFT_1133670 [Ephemerocybe angulata]|uniref:Uncharacterized protein n=1 Tax=Ephemerocybe angulata TaxID=980116 RepID=A0A8H6HTQ8_9AGAR|nr:hypothetical protein DFP72DRAFT_1133670 [Tulosesus angulatus]
MQFKSSFTASLVLIATAIGTCNAQWESGEIEVVCQTSNTSPTQSDALELANQIERMGGELCGKNQTVECWHVRSFGTASVNYCALPCAPVKTVADFIRRIANECPKSGGKVGGRVDVTHYSEGHIDLYHS